MSADEVPEVVEVPVDRVEVTLTLDMLLDGLAQEAVEIAEGRAGAAPNQEAADRLKRVSELARQVTSEVREMQRVNPRVFQRLELGRNRLRPELPNLPGGPSRPGLPRRPNRPDVG